MQAQVIRVDVEGQDVLELGIAEGRGDLGAEPGIARLGAMQDLTGHDFGQPVDEVPDRRFVLHHVLGQDAFQPNLSGGVGRSRASGLGLSHRLGGGLIAGQQLQVFAHAADAFRIGLGATLMMFQLGAQDIARRQEGIHHFRAQGQLFLSESIQQRLQNMGDAGHVGEAEGAAAALDRVRRPENGVQVFQRRRLHIQVEQEGFHIGQVLSGLLEEHLVKLAHVDGHRVSV